MSMHRFQDLVAKPQPAQPGFVPVPTALLLAMPDGQRSLLGQLYELARKRAEADLRSPWLDRMRHVIWN
jgi:hypothetical protein